MKLNNRLPTLFCSLMATAFVVVGMSSLAEKFDPVAARSSTATAIEIASGATSPCEVPRSTIRGNNA